MSTTRSNSTAIYVRVSSTKESQQFSPEHQEAVCREKARQLQLQISEAYIYEDRDTGTNIVTRPAIRQMLKDAQYHHFDNVIFASLSRFSRDTLDSISLKRMLVNTLGKRLIAIDEGYDSDVDRDELKFQIIAAVNQKHSEQISFSSRRGKRQSALKGNYTGSVPPYGYKKTVVSNKKTLIPDPTTLPIIQLIFDLYTLQKMGERAIVNYLNAQNIPSPRKGLWGVSTLQRILQNEAYTGVNVFGKYETAIIYNDLSDMTNRTRKLIARKKELWEKAHQPITHQPIISKEQFEDAQKLRLLRGGGSRGGVRQVKNILSGLIFCKNCGCAMVSMASTRQNKNTTKSYRYLICSKRRRQGEKGCSNNYWLPYDTFKEELISFLSSHLQAFRPDQQLFEKLEPFLQTQINHWEQQLEKQTRMLTQSRMQLMQLRKEQVFGQIDESQFQFEKEQLEREIHSLEQILQKQPKQPLQALQHEQINQKLHHAISNLVHLNYEEAEHFDKLRFLLHELLQLITVHANGHIQVFTTFKHELNTIKPHLECDVV